MIGQAGAIKEILSDSPRPQKAIRIRTRHEKAANAAIIVEEDPSAAGVVLGVVQIVRPFQRPKAGLPEAELIEFGAVMSPVRGQPVRSEKGDHLHQKREGQYAERPFSGVRQVFSFHFDQFSSSAWLEIGQALD